MYVIRDLLISIQRAAACFASVSNDKVYSPAPVCIVRRLCALAIGEIYTRHLISSDFL